MILNYKDWIKERKILNEERMDVGVEPGPNIFGGLYDLAKKLVFLSGNSLKTDLNPDGDIEIQFTGLRPGEKLYEELLIGGNPEATTNKRIFRAKEDFLPLAELEIHLQRLNDALHSRDFELLHNILLKLVEGYNKPSLEPHST